MQASKIKVKGRYAIYDQNKQLVRFYVTSVVTSRTDNTGSPHDYSSKVNGHIDTGDWTNDADNNRLSLDPEKILGPYEDYKELVERERAENAAKQAASDARDQLGFDLRRALYALIGEPCPNDERGHRQFFRFTYGGGVDISGDAAQRVIDALRRRE